MRVSINQPAYLPWLGYFDRIAKSDLHIVLDHVQFEKNSFVNRNRIKTANGLVWLTVPVRTKGKFGELPISEVSIDNSASWRRKHWKSLQLNYARAPHFGDYRGFLEEAYSKLWVSLLELNMHFIRFLLEKLDIQTPLVFSSSLKPQETKSRLVLELCQKAGATQYLSGSLGRDYLDLPSFRDQGIEVEFQDYEHPEYPQLHGPFAGHLSTLDLLLNCGKESYEKKIVGHSRPS